MITTILIILILALTLYAVLGGADFGAGVWEFNTALRSNDRERNLLHHAIGPVWETNHVWLIFVIVILFGAFPPAFASLNQALFVPLFLALVGIVFRGAAYAFRSQLKTDTTRQWQSELWIAIFALASVLAPFCLGASVGAIASGQLEFDANRNFSGDYLTGWINSLSLFTGFFAVGICAYVTAVYMIRESVLSCQKSLRKENEEDLAELWRRRALGTGAVMGLFSVIGLVLIATQYVDLRNGMLLRGWPWVFVSVGAGLYSTPISAERKSMTVLPVFARDFRGKLIFLSVFVIEFPV